MEAIDRRKAERYPIGVPIRFERGNGITRDVSGLGVYFKTEAGFRVSDELTFTMVVPEAVSLECRGRIVRVEEEGSGFGVAATIDTFSVAEGALEMGQGEPGHIIIRELRRHHK